MKIKNITAMKQFIKDMKRSYGADVFTPKSERHYLQMEKKTITDAFYAGSFHSIGEDGEKYYNKKFNP